MQLPRLTNWQGDISSYAGQTGELRFTVVPGEDISVINVNGFAAADLDDIRFSTQTVPEPPATSLVLGGLALFSFARLRRFFAESAGRG
jgi:hypothetical protein